MLAAARPGQRHHFGVILIAALYWAGVPLFTMFMLVSPGVSLLLGFSAAVWGGWIVVLAAFLYVRRPYLIESLAVLAANLAAGALTLPLWTRLEPSTSRTGCSSSSTPADPRGAGWQLVQSQVAIGSGGLFGPGLRHGPQKRLSFLPEQHTDFIFSVVGEELGFIGVVVLPGPARLVPAAVPSPTRGTRRRVRRHRSSSACSPCGSHTC